MNPFRYLVACLGVCGLLGLSASAGAMAQAQTPPSLPQGFTQEQYDGLVDAISRAVAKRLREEPAPGATPAASSTPASVAAPAASASEDGVLAQEAAAFAERAGAVMRAFPDLIGAYRALPAALDRSAQGGRGLWSFIAMAVVALGLAIGSERAVAAALAPFRARLVSGAAAEAGRGGLARLAGLALLDLVGLATVWAAAGVLSGLWFAGSDGQARLGAALLSAAFAWRLYMLAFRIVLRPATPQARLAAMSDEDAHAVYTRVSAIVLLILAGRIALRVAVALQAPQDAVAAGQIVQNLALLGVFLWVSVASRRAVAGWFVGLAGASGAGQTLGRHWLAIAVPFFVALCGAQVYGAVLRKPAIPAAMLFTLNAVLSVILFRTLVEAVERRAAHTSREAAFGLLARCLTVAVLIAAGVLIAQTWIVDVLGLVDAKGWRALTRSSLTAGLTLFMAYVGFELVGFYTRRYETTQGPGGPAEEDEHAAAASRVATLMPLMRTALLAFIGVIALLVVLSEWGVNITPLIAGASVFGLALSFGSQTLVRDIVSGVFYLADDAFRVGEYIDCGKAKGTVEGFTLRSIRLRHQNGQVHTIPFGQLGQITNFSRDWTTVKFNLRFARDTDVEKLRKTVKKIGQEMLDDPEMKDEFLAPLKLQGVADVADNALIMRFKFTVRPGKPSYIQREAVKRMVRAFPELGIEFANSMVSVQALGEHVDSAAAGAAVTSLLQRVKAAETTGAG
ncbi:mechanosensitive ion channel domain-containing protein [Alsobacter sp. KACC 23698]|uniref:Mechanosensitive ion channel domain-containing protein n=1 Tax=Alsobacter sp. KACC 23698 TaxID=3149229 RepID=A0AAU7J9U5_9HYPH